MDTFTLSLTLYTVYQILSDENSKHHYKRTIYHKTNGLLSGSSTWAIEGRGFVHSKREPSASSVVYFWRGKYDQREPFPSLAELRLPRYVNEAYSCSIRRLRHYRPMQTPNILAASPQSRTVMRRKGG